MTHIIDTPEMLRVINSLEDGEPLLDIIKQISSAGSLFISAISHGEVERVIESLVDAAARNQARMQYRQILASIGNQRMHAFDEPVAERWSEICQVVSPQAYPDVSSETLMVAATASYFQYELICQKQTWHQAVPELVYCYV
jgi:hypothetical protein